MVSKDTDNFSYNLIPFKASWLITTVSRSGRGTVATGTDGGYKADAAMNERQKKLLVNE
jgi:hypothetical protein